MIVNIAAPVYLVAQVKTAIAGRMVPSWVRPGHRSQNKMRPMPVSQFIIEAVTKAVEGVEPSPAALEWAAQKVAQGRENHAIATKERWAKRRAKRGVCKDTHSKE